MNDRPTQSVNLKPANPQPTVLRDSQGFPVYPQFELGFYHEVGRFRPLGIQCNTVDVELAALRDIAHSTVYSAVGQDASCVRCVEVGTWCGESALMLATGLQEALELVCSARHDSGYSASLTCVDHFQGSATDLSGPIAKGYGGDMYELWRMNTAPASYLTPKVEMECLRMDSHAASLLIPDHSLHIAFLDAGHSGPEIKQDLEDWYPKMRPGSILCGHDYGDAFVDLIREVDFFCRKTLHCCPILLDKTRIWLAKIPLSMD